MELSGVVEQVLPIESGTAKNGKEWKKQVVVIDTGGTYPKKVALTCFGKVLDFLPKQGDAVNCQIEIESRESGGRWYTEAKAWRIDVVKTEPMHTVPPMGNAVDGLPF